jgi:hypothetical protein
MKPFPKYPQEPFIFHFTSKLSHPIRRETLPQRPGIPGGPQGWFAKMFGLRKYPVIRNNLYIETAIV